MKRKEGKWKIKKPRLYPISRFFPSRDIKLVGFYNSSLIKGWGFEVVYEYEYYGSICVIMIQELHTECRSTEQALVATPPVVAERLLAVPVARSIASVAPEYGTGITALNQFQGSPGFIITQKPSSASPAHRWVSQLSRRVWGYCLHQPVGSKYELID